MTDLGTLSRTRASGVYGSWASGINNKGQIVGGSSTKTGQTHAVLWTLRSG